MTGKNKLLHLPLNIPPSSSDGLQTRGITPQAINYAQIRTAQRGWLYPVAPHLTIKRFKAFPGQPGAKYRWHPHRPATARFYDPRGQLADHIAAAGGVLYLASGEPDSWILFSAEIFNATCTLHGEGTIPPWFVEELHRLAVTTVNVWPDCDPAGLRHAAKISAVLVGTGITVEIRALPYANDSKADLNTLWLDQNRDRQAFSAALANCPPVMLPEPAAMPPHPRPVTGPRSTSATWENYLTNEFDPRIPAAWLQGSRSQQGFHKNAPCPNPAHTDGTPSFGYNPESRTGYCFVCGTFHTGDLAGFIGAPIYEHPTPLPPIRRPSQPAQKPTATHHFANGIPTRLIEFLLNLHGDPWLNIKRRDMQDAGSAAVVWYDWHEQVLAGQIDPTAPITASSLLTHSRHGISWDTAKAGLDRLTEIGIFGVFTPYTESTHDKEQKLRKCGRRGKQYVALPLEQALAALLDYVAPYVLRTVLVTQFPDIPVSAHHVVGIITGLSPDDIRTIDDRCADLYARYAGEREAALQEYHRRLAFMRVKYLRGVLTPATQFPVVPFSLPAGIPVSNAAAFRNAVDDLDMQQHAGERDAQARRAAARRTGRTLAAHTQAAKKRDIVSIPQVEMHALDARTDVVSQCVDLDVAALARGAIRLVADDGAQIYVHDEQAEFDYDDWIVQHGGATIEIRRASIEKRVELVTEEEQVLIADLSARQSARSGQHTGSLSTPTGHPLHAWTIRQGELRAGVFGLQAVPEKNPACYIDVATGEVFDRTIIWHGILSVIRGDLAAPSLSAAAGSALENQRAASPVLESGAVAPEPGSAAPPGCYCVVCGQPATRTLLDGYYCLDHARLSWEERQRASGTAPRHQPRGRNAPDVPPAASSVPPPLL